MGEMQQALRADVGDSGSQINQILDMFNQGQWDDGLEALAAMADKTNSPEAHITLGEEYASRGRYEEALDQYFKALEHEPKNLDAFFHMGCAFIGQGDYDAAKVTSMI